MLLNVMLIQCRRPTVKKITTSRCTRASSDDVDDDEDDDEEDDDD